MRVAVVTSSPPFSEGGHLVIARALEAALAQEGHTARIVVTPQNRFGRQAAAYLATWLTDVGLADDGGPVDRVISLRYPSYAVRHPHHVCWLNHTMREYYDLWDRFSAPLSSRARAKEQVRRHLIRLADRQLLSRNVRRVYAQSRTVAERLTLYLNLRAEVLYPPPPPRPYRCDGYGDYLFVVSRLTPLKRVDLVLRALARPEAAGIRCVVAGDGGARPALEALAREQGIVDRVRFEGAITETALVEHLAACRAVVFVPFAEDYGLVTAEAFASGKAVLTCTDSGGPAELVVDGERGFVRPPDPGALAAAMRHLMDDAALAGRLGSAARGFAAALSWPRVIAALMAG